jgi:hypothetical protein
MNFFPYYDGFRMGAANRWHLTDGVTFKDPNRFFHHAMWQQYSAAAKMRMKNQKDKAVYLEQVAEQLLAEQYWVDKGRPHVKVYPKMAQLLSRIHLNVPMALLKLPYPAFAIRFSAEQDSFLREDPSSPPIQSLFVFGGMEHHLPNEALARLGKVMRGPIDVEQLAASMPPIRPRPKSPMEFISVYYSRGFGMADLADGFVQLKYDPTRTIAQAMKDIEGGNEVTFSQEMSKLVGRPPWWFLERLMSITLATCLMVEGDENNVLPDLPNKLVPRYDAAQKLGGKQQEKAVSDIMEQAKKKGHNGFSIGQRHELELPRPVYEKREKTEGEEEESNRHYELHWSHYRSPHPRLQRYGSRTNPQYKVVIVNLTQVRPDLPLDPRPKNIRITDRVLEE